MKQALIALILAAVVPGCGSGGSRNASANRDSPLSAGELQELSAGWKTDFARHSVPLREFQSGGPGKDGIPALDRPRFVRVAEASFLRPREPVIALMLAGRARAYPLQILTWHEIVNDVVAGVPVAVTFCPLCNTAIAFDRRVEGRTLSFGTTGNLRNSDLVMYDRQTESWWQQFGGEGVVGRYAGTRLRTQPVRIVAWRSFRAQHPDGLVLSRNTGYSRPYGENPYAGYDDVSSPTSGSPVNCRGCPSGPCRVRPGRGAREAHEGHRGRAGRPEARPPRSFPRRFATAEQPDSGSPRHRPA
jgi:Protein of unknown function (DUF3179)